MQENRHVLQVLKEAKKAASRYDVLELKKLSDQTIHSATIYQDSDNILVAVLIYAIGKLIERRDRFDSKSFNIYFSFYNKAIDELIKVIISGDEKLIKNKFSDIENVKGLSEELKQSVIDVFRKAKINKASKIYEHGISMSATADLLGVSLWEIAEYTGQSGVSDASLNKTMDIKKRARMALEFFG